MTKFPVGRYDLVAKAIRINAQPNKEFSAHDVVHWMKGMYSERSVPTRKYIVARLRKLDGIARIQEFNNDGTVKGVRFVWTGEFDERI